MTKIPFEPGREPPPVKERPHCAFCGKRRVPEIHGGLQYITGAYAGNRYWTGRYKGYGRFCTLRCCERFANAAYAAGFRVYGREE